MLLRRPDQAAPPAAQATGRTYTYSLGHRESDGTTSAWKEALQTGLAQATAASAQRPAQKLRSAPHTSQRLPRPRAGERPAPRIRRSVQRARSRLALRSRHQAGAAAGRARSGAARCTAGAWSTHRARRTRSIAPQRAPPPGAPRRCCMLHHVNYDPIPGQTVLRTASQCMRCRCAPRATRTAVTGAANVCAWEVLNPPSRLRRWQLRLCLTATSVTRAHPHKRSPVTCRHSHNQPMAMLGQSVPPRGARKGPGTPRTGRHPPNYVLRAPRRPPRTSAGTTPAAQAALLACTCCSAVLMLAVGLVRLCSVRKINDIPSLQKQQW